MNLPTDIINLIMSYTVKYKCYRCNKIIQPYEQYIRYSKFIFCSQICTEYQHY